MTKVSQVIRAVRAIIHLSEKPVEVFLLPDGKYQMSQTSTTRAVKKQEQSIRQFRASKHSKALPYKNLPSVKCNVEGESANIALVPLDLAVAYWSKEALAGNLEAVHLLAALANRSLTQMCDEAFGVTRDQQERDSQLAFDLSDEAKQIREQLMMQMRLEELRNSNQQTALQIQLSKEREFATQERLIVMQERITASNRFLVEVHGVETLAMIQGRPDAIVTREKPVLVVVDSTGKIIDKTDGMYFTAMQKALGLNANQLDRVLNYLGYGRETSDKWKPAPVLQHGSVLPFEDYDHLKREIGARPYEIKRLLGNRQQLLGEMPTL